MDPDEERCVRPSTVSHPMSPGMSVPRVCREKSLAIILLSLALITTGCFFARAADSVPISAAPTNDAAAAYGQAWTGTLAWSQVFRIQDYGGKGDGAGDNGPSLERAEAAAIAVGGGVIFFPSGTYVFANDVVLRSGIILRGQDPAPVRNAPDPRYAPPTRFEFPQYHFSSIGTGADAGTAFKGIHTLNPAADSNVGVVNIAVNRGFIDLGDNKIRGPGFRAGSNRLVVGCTVRNAVMPQGYFHFDWEPAVPTSWQYPWQRYTDPFSFAIRVISTSNALVANNRLLPATDNFVENGYLIHDTKKNVVTVDGVLFDYDNRYGIIVNRSWAGVNGTRNGFAATRDTDPILFGTGVLIADNYIRNTGRVALYAAGQGAIIRHNTALNQPDGLVGRYGTDGTREANGSSTFEDRGIDFCGYDVTVDGNSYEAHQGKLLVNYPRVNDGEGILMQEWSGTSAINETITHNTGNSYIGLYDEGRILHCEITDNTVTEGDIQVFSRKETGPSEVKNNTIARNHLKGGIHVGGYAPTCGGNRVIDNQSGSPQKLTLEGTVHDPQHGGDTVVEGNRNLDVVDK